MSSNLILAFGNPVAFSAAGAGTSPDAFMRELLGIPGIAGARRYRIASEQPTPVALGKRPPSPYDRLVVYDIGSGDPAPIFSAFAQRADAWQRVGSAQTPRFAYWLYSPITELKRKPDATAGAEHLHLAFTNSVPGRDAEYNKWYSEEHMVHALLAHGFTTAQRFKLALDGSGECRVFGADPSPYRYVTLYGLQTDDLRASEDDMHKYATGEKPGMVLSDTMAPTRATWVYSPEP